MNPNPLVGCVIVHQGEVISEGWHKAYGESHAERMAIDTYLDAGGNADIFKECDIYVSLEPCSHHGKTPPCADLLVKHGFRKVFIAQLDPNVLVSGKGIQRLRDSGMEVEVGFLQVETRLQNRFFLCYHEKKRPYVILKWAETADGFIAPLSRERMSISGHESQKYVHALRQECSAILVGRSTFEGDKPQLTDRFFGGPQPAKFVLSASTDNEESFEGYLDGFQLVSNGNQLVQQCMERGLNSVLVEGGLQTLNHFLTESLVDEIHVIKSKKRVLSTGIMSPEFHLDDLGLQSVLITENVDDLIFVYRRKI